MAATVWKGTATHAFRPGRAILWAALMVPPLLAGRHATAGEPGAALAASGIIIPDEAKDLRILSADIDIRLPRPQPYKPLYITVRSEYRLRNEASAPAHVRVSLPIHGEIGGPEAPNPDLRPAARFDGVSIPYSHVPCTQLAELYLRPWREKAWQLLEAVDPELKALLESMRGTEGHAGGDAIRAIQAHHRAHADRYGNPAPAWLDHISFFLAHRPHRRHHWYTLVQAVHETMRVLDPEYDRGTYDLDRILPKHWELDVPWMLDPYDRRLYHAEGVLYEGPKGGAITVLQCDVKLLPGRDHSLVIFYRQHPGFDKPYRPGDSPSGQFCHVMKTARHWEKWDQTRVTVRYPAGTRQIKFRGLYGWYGKVRQEGHFHVATGIFGRPECDLYIGWAR